MNFLDLTLNVFYQALFRKKKIKNRISRYARLRDLVCQS